MALVSWAPLVLLLVASLATSWAPKVGGSSVDDSAAASDFSSWPMEPEMSLWRPFRAQPMGWPRADPLVAAYKSGRSTPTSDEPTGKALSHGAGLGAKMGPEFTREPPALIYYTNSSDLVINCAASGQPEPTITWWHREQQLDVGSILDRRYVRYDNSLVISSFKSADFEPEVHSTAYRCQASNSFGTITSRDVVINAVIERELDISVADQFVSVDNDAIFRCHLAPEVREFAQIVGWLQDGQQYLPFASAAASSRPSAGSGKLGPKMGAQTSAGAGRQPVVLPDGSLLVPRVQLKDANKSFRCQVKNLLNSRISLSAIGGRLFVTDSSEQTGASARIVKAPKPTTGAILGEPLQLWCVAQGAPRPQVRWFRRQAAPADSSSGDSGSPDSQDKLATAKDANNQQDQDQDQDHDADLDWQEVGAHNQNGAPNWGASLSVDANSVLIHKLQASDDASKWRCLANNSFGTHSASTQLRLLADRQAAPVELEPKLEFVNGLASTTGTGSASGSSSQRLSLNCTLRQALWNAETSAFEPLLGVEWLRNGRPLLGVPWLEAPAMEPSWNGSSSSAPGVDLFEWPQEKLVASVEQLALASSQQQQLAAQGDERHLRLRQSLTRVPATPIGGARGGGAVRTLLYQLQLAPVRRQDRGSYQCRARYPRDTLHATGHLVLRDQAPQFVDAFQSQLVIVTGTGSGRPLSAQSQQADTPTPPTISGPSPSVSLRCVASGSPLPEIGWSLSGFPIPESSRIRVGDFVTRDGLIVSFVNISQIQPEDGGLYECLASNEAGQLAHAGWLNVTGAPVVRPMASLSAVAGASLTVMCPAGGWPVDQISWYQNSTKLPANHRQKLFPNGTLVISELNEVTDAGQYQCQARAFGQSSDSVASNQLQLSIKVPPVVEPFSFAKSLHRGQRYNIMCTVVRGDLPVAIRWFKDGRALLAAPEASGESSAGDGLLAVKQLDPYSSTLTFSSLQSSHRGQYTCEAQNEAGRANQSSHLVIHVPPEWRIEPRDTSVTVGKTAVIDCQADSFPAARIEWRLSQDLYREPPSEFKPISSSLYMHVFENGSLIIYNSQRSDAGYYLCQAQNGVGPGLSRVIKLTVHVAAHFKSKIRTELVRRGQPAKLRCEALGDPPIEVSWLRDKTPLGAEQGGASGATLDARYLLVRSPLADGLLSELHIPETEPSDSALFTCITQNSYGNDDTNIQLLVQSAPSAPVDVRIHEFESRAVRVSWIPGDTGNAPLLGYLVMYGQLEHHHSSSAGRFVNVSVAANETSVQLQPLQPLTEYQFYMLAQNSLGYSKLPTEPIKFRTDDEAPAAPPTITKAYALSSRAIRVRWRPPEARAHFGQPAGFYVGYKPLRPDSGATPSNEPLNAAKGVAARAETFIYKTVELIGGGVGAQPSAGGALQVRQAPEAMSTPPNSNTNNNLMLSEQHADLTGLRRGQRYLIQVQAFNRKGAGPNSEPAIAETWRVDVPEPPSLRLVQRSSHSVQLAWRPQQATQSDQNDIDSSDSGAAPSEPITGYVLSRRQLPPVEQAILGGGSDTYSLGAPSDAKPVELRLPGDHQSQLVDKLTCGTRYQFTVSAVNSVGVSAPSEPLTVKTEGSLPVAPDKNSLMSLNASSLLLNLNSWHNGACSMKSYEVSYKQSKSSKWIPVTTVQFAATNNATSGLMAPVNGSSQAASEPSRTSVGAAGEATPFVDTPQRLSSSGSNSNTIKQQVQLTNNGTVLLEHLAPALNYDLKIVATNEAGSTEAYYSFNSQSGLKLNGLMAHSDHYATSTNHWDSPPDESQGYRMGATGTHLFAPGGYAANLAVPLVSWLLVGMLFALVITVSCFLMNRRRQLGGSDCSLSLSSSGASRSNRSSNNYYDNTHTKGTMKLSGDANKFTCANQQQSAQRAQLLGGSCATDGENSPFGPKNNNRSGDTTLGGSQNVQGHHHHVHAEHNLSSTNATYAYLQRPPSAAGTELCLGASAITMANTTTGVDKSTPDYYVSPIINLQQQQQAVKLAQLGKSATLPPNCHHQQLISQLMNAAETGASHSDQPQQQQHLVESLMGNNLLSQCSQQQQQQDQYPQHAEVQHQNQQMSNLIESQLQQQVYATVKRGYQRPARLFADYSIYQCPNVQSQTFDGHEQQQKQQLAVALRCCANELAGTSSAVALGAHEHLQGYLDAANSAGSYQNEQAHLQLQQLQQLQLQHNSSDYQQLRPSMN